MSQGEILFVGREKTRKEVTDIDEKILRYVERVTVWDEKIDVELKGNVKNTAEKAD
jgi:hypothetical protein